MTRIKTLLFAICLTIATPALSDYWDAIESTRFDIGATTGNFIGIKRNYFEFGTFVPVSLSYDWVTFADARGYYFQDNKWGASAGAGIRYPYEDLNYVWGLNTYYDYLEGHFHDFHRIGVGLEFLSPYLDIRVNGYFPINRRYSANDHIFSVDSLNAFHAKSERAIGDGFDAEIGLPFGSWCWFTTYGAVGTYCYESNKHNKRNFWGAQGRLEANWNTYLSLQLRGSYDQIYHAQGQFLIQFSLPFEALSCCFEDCGIPIMLQPVKRTGIIFTNAFSNFFWQVD